MKKYISLLGVGLLSLAVFSPAFAQSISASSAASTKAQIIQLITQLLQQLEAELQTLLAQQGSTSTTSSAQTTTTSTNTGSTQTTTSTIPTITSISTSQVTAGVATPVTLYGSNFNSTLMVALTGPGADTSVSPTSVSSDGTSLTFNFPATITAPGTYSVQIYNYSVPTYSTININLVSSTSTNPPTQPVITVTSPTASTLQVGQTYNISWTETPSSATNTYTIRDYATQQVITTLTRAQAGCANSDICTFAWTPTQATSNDYVAVSDYTNSAFGRSGSFAILTSINQASTPTITSINPTQGAGNNIIVITGTNLNASGNQIQYYQNGQLVGSQYGGSPSVDGTSLQFPLSEIFAVNANPGVYQLRIVNTNGTSNFVNFTILGSQQANTPVINSITPNDGGLGTYVISGSGFTSSNGVTTLEFYQNGKMAASATAQNISSSGTQFQITLSGAFVANVPSGLYQVDVSNSNGKSNSINFTLFDQPV